MEILERISATLVGFVVMMAVAIGLGIGMDVPPFIVGPIVFAVFVLVYRVVRRGFQRLQKQRRSRPESSQTPMR